MSETSGSKMKFDLRAALRRAKQMKTRWRNGAGPYSMSEKDPKKKYIDEDDETPIEKQLIKENLAEDKNEAPGPGQYYSYEKFSTLNVQYKDPSHQFFNSTEDRFKGSLFSIEES
jgi:hypothetical protein